MAWRRLDPSDRALWVGFREARPSLCSPFFSLGWFDAIDAARGDLMVARILAEDRPVGFLPHHRSPLGALRPAGGPLSDWHGVISAGPVGVNIDQLLQATGAGAIAFTGVPPDDPLLAPLATRRLDSLIMDVGEGYAAYEATVRARHAKAFRNLRVRQKRLEPHKVELRLDDRDRRSFDALVAMKRAQYQRTRQIDIFGPRWTKDLIEGLFLAPADAETRGLLSSLWIDGALAAAHFGLKADGTLHHWFPVYDQRLAHVSPGIVLLHALAAHGPELGVRRIDLGGGDYRFKEEFANAMVPMLAGVVRRPTLMGGAATGMSALARGIAGLPIGRFADLPQRLNRRLDRMMSLHEAPAKGRREA